jgi:hypothetical protein
MPSKLTALLALFLSFLFTVSCDGSPRASSVTLTNQDSLEFLVMESDMIAIVNIAGGAEKPRILSFGDMPNKVNATVLSVIKGDEGVDSIKLYSEPQNPPPDAVKSSVVLRKGRHLVFLCKNGDGYKPTTRFSLLEVFNDRVYPIWKQKGNSSEITSGYPLREIIKEIENLAK